MYPISGAGPAPPVAIARVSPAPPASLAPLFAGFFRRRKNPRIATIAIPNTPPTTPPAIAPTFVELPPPLLGVVAGGAVELVVTVTVEPGPPPPPPPALVVCPYGVVETDPDDMDVLVDEAVTEL